MPFVVSLSSPVSKSSLLHLLTLRLVRFSRDWYRECLCSFALCRQTHAVAYASFFQVVLIVTMIKFLAKV